MKELILKILKRSHPWEIVFTVAIILSINTIFSPDNPLFLNSTYNPYFIAILFFGMFYGKISGLFTLGISITAFSLITTIINQYEIPGYKIIDPIYIYNSSHYYKGFLKFLFITLFLIIILGEIRDTLGVVINKLKSQRKKLIKQYDNKVKELKALSIVNDEYQDRILGQQSSIISLYSTIVELNSLKLEKIYPSILSAVNRFISAQKCSLWIYKPDEGILELLGHYGWDKTEEREKQTIETKNSLAGWVARNNTIFSINLLQKFDSLQHMDTRENIMTIPIVIDNHVWGLINIEKIPFIKYNLYSEQLLNMIADLSAPVIKNALRFKELTREGEVDAVSGLHSIDEMFVLAEEDFKRAVANKSHLSMVIVEVSNFDKLTENFTESDGLVILNQISQLTLELMRGGSAAFQYKDKNQFCILIPGMDFDGCAMFCLSLIEEHNQKEYFINNQRVFPEILMGYSSLRPEHNSEEDLFFLAENLLTLQKI